MQIPPRACGPVPTGSRPFRGRAGLPADALAQLDGLACSLRLSSRPWSDESSVTSTAKKSTTPRQKNVMILSSVSPSRPSPLSPAKAGAATSSDVAKTKIGASSLIASKRYLCRGLGCACGGADAGRHRRRRSGRAGARPSAAPAGHRLGGARGAQPRLRRAPRARRRARAGHRRPAQADGRRGAAWSARGWCTAASSCASPDAGTGSTSTTSPAAAAITVYGQQEVVKDLIARAAGVRRPAAVRGGRRAAARDRHRRAVAQLPPRRRGANARCDAIAGCDGFHGVCRDAVPAGVLTFHEREWPFAWLGILAEARPSSEELIYAHHERGFALHSMRSPEVTRLYLQCAPDEKLEDWPDERIWAELQTRFASGDFRLTRGPDLRARHHADAQLRDRADAARPALPRRRRGPHRAARPAPRG